MGKENTKKTQDEVVAFITKSGCTHISGKYDNNTSRLLVGCPNNHQYYTTWKKLKQGFGCPTCHGSSKITIDQIVSIAEPRGYKVLSVGSNRKLVLMCPHGKEWETSHVRFRNGCDCPCLNEYREKDQKDVESKLSSAGYKLVSPYKGTSVSSTLVCINCGNERKTSIQRLLNMPECRKCSVDTGLQDKSCEISEVLALDGYQLASSYNGVDKPMILLCPKGHEWRTDWTHFKLGRRCFECYGTKKVADEEIDALLLSEGYKRLSEYRNSNSKILLLCPKGHKWKTLFGSFKYRKHRCPSCHYNRPEKELMEFIQLLGIVATPNTKKVIHPFQLDIFIENLNIAIEYCGVYWHSEKFRDRNYHLNKTRLCNEKGIRLITLFEDEWVNKKEIVKSKIMSLLGAQRRIFARKCRVSEVKLEEAKKFINDNHLQGYSPSVKAFGLYHKDELVSCLTIGKHHRQNTKYKWVLNRFCNKKEITIVGGASRLLRQTSEFRPLVSWSDTRWSDGDVYKALGFTLDGTLPPDYSYFAKYPKLRVSKQSLKKTELEKLSGLTEHQLRLQQGLLRIYDCGKRRWVLWE